MHGFIRGRDVPGQRTPSNFKELSNYLSSSNVRAPTGKNYVMGPDWASGGDPWKIFGGPI